MTTFLLITLLMTGAAKIQHRHSRAAIATRIDDGVATRQEKEKFLRWAEAVADKAERRQRQ